MLGSPTQKPCQGSLNPSRFSMRLFFPLFASLRFSLFASLFAFDFPLTIRTRFCYHLQALCWTADGRQDARRHSQVAKATVCKTVIRRFESACRLQIIFPLRPLTFPDGLFFYDFHQLPVRQDANPFLSASWRPRRCRALFRARPRLLEYAPAARPRERFFVDETMGPPSIADRPTGGADPLPRTLGARRPRSPKTAFWVIMGPIRGGGEASPSRRRAPLGEPSF